MATTPTTVDGQPLGERGLRTRRRILEAVGAAIRERGLRGLRIADIAEEVGFKPPAFYQYFTDIDEAILALCREAGDLLPPLVLDTDEWDDGPGAGAHPFVERFFGYWDEHRGLLTARHLAIMSGDERFQEVADDAFRPVAAALQVKIADAQSEGRSDPRLEPVALGAVLNLMIDVAAMASPDLQSYWWGSDASELVDAVSYVFGRVLGVDPSVEERPDPSATAT
mgnify:CR=1 FL=1